MKEILSLLSQWDSSPHLSDGYVTDYFGHSNSGYPQEAKDQQGPLFASSVPPTLPALVFHLLSYGEWGPLLNLTDHLENDHLRDFSH